jgi:hypothetical protein
MWNLRVLTSLQIRVLEAQPIISPDVLNGMTHAMHAVHCSVT